MPAGFAHPLCTLIACAAAGGIVLAQPSFRSAVDLVRVTATVTSDGGGRHMTGLSRDDFVVVDG
jgi:hypothetical protein